MERNYYAINETAARQAQGMWSFSDYVEGSQTAEYKQLVDRAYDLADKVAEEKGDRSEKAYALADRYARKLADNLNAKNHIDCMCPSVMIAGPANFPVKKKERQNRAAERNHQEYQDIQQYLEKIRKLLYGDQVIKSGDRDAIEKLQEKLDMLQRNQEQMKAANAYYRKHKTLDGCPGLSPEDHKRLKAEMESNWHYEDKPFQSYKLSNNNQNIRATKKRLEQMKKEKGKETEAYATKHFQVTENTDTMRPQLFFDGKPEAEIQEAVKRNGFHWSPKNHCWQRQLTNHARDSLKCLVRELDQLAG